MGPIISQIVVKRIADANATGRPDARAMKSENSANFFMIVIFIPDPKRKADCSSVLSDIAAFSSKAAAVERISLKVYR
jgi:hypothetical protein